jgi:hypothetical protein
MSSSGNYIDLKKFNSQIQKSYLCINGGTMNGNINMSCNDITNINQIVFCDGSFIDSSGTIVLNLSSIPTTNPNNEGQLWRDASGNLKISLG